MCSSRISRARFSFSPRLPFLLATEFGPRNVALTAEIADGWLPTFYSPLRASEVWGPALREGFERAGEPGKAPRLRNSPWVLGDERRLARIVLHGMDESPN